MGARKPEDGTAVIEVYPRAENTVVRVRVSARVGCARCDGATRWEGENLGESERRAR